MQGKIIAVNGAQQLKVDECEIPAAIGPNEYLVEIDYSLISPGTELGDYNGPAFDKSYVPGYTGVGRVKQAGSECDSELVGNEVFMYPAKHDSNHCHAGFKVFHADGLLLPYPDSLPGDKACFARMVNIGLTPYAVAGPGTMGSVMVIGLGPIGNICGQIGKLRGMQVIGIEMDAKRRERALASGFDQVIDPGTDDALEAVKELTGGKGVDLSVNATGHAAPFMLSLQAAANGGEVSTLGGARHESEGSLMTVMNEIHARHLTVRGGWEHNLPMRSTPACDQPSSEENLKNCFRWLADGSIDLEQIWTHTIKPDEFKQAYDALNDRDDSYFGVIVDWK